MNDILFFQPCQPPKTTYQSGSTIFRRKDGTPMIGRNKKGEQLKQTLFEILKPHQPPEPLEGPLHLGIKYVYPWRKSEPKKNQTEGWKWCDKRPDSDNIAKQICDVMTLLNFYHDDGQVASLSVEKLWGDVAGIGISLHSA